MKKRAFTLAEGAAHANIGNNHCRAAFTLAEVLITLLVIGVVAALTIPALLQSYKDRQIVTAVQKAANTLTNAYKLTVVDEGEPTSWFTEETGSNGIDKLFSHLATTKVCAADENGNCFSDAAVYTLDGTQETGESVYNNFPSAQMADGAAVAYHHHSDDCTNNNSHNVDGNPSYCGRLWYDIDGPDKGSNTVGKDLFTFALTTEGVKADSEDGANDSTKQDFEAQSCDPTITSIRNGKGCSAYILQNRSADYLHKKAE